MLRLASVSEVLKRRVGSSLSLFSLPLDAELNELRILNLDASLAQEPLEHQPETRYTGTSGQQCVRSMVFGVLY